MTPWNKVTTELTGKKKRLEDNTRLGQLKQTAITALGIKVDHEAEMEDEEADENFVDIVEELELKVQPIVEELGQPDILKAKKEGTLDPFDDDTLGVFRKHKASQGKAVFEAENANNLGVEHFNVGEVHAALAYFEKALTLSSTARKPAAQEHDDFVKFLEDKFQMDTKEFYSSLFAGEWRLAVARREFTTALKKMRYPGESDRLFTLLDKVSGDDGDGKITQIEIDALVKVRPLRLVQLDREHMEKGVVLNNIGACYLQKGEASTALQKLREAAKIICRVAPGREDDHHAHRILANMATAYIHLRDYDAALHYLNMVLARREDRFGVTDSDALNALYLIGYSFLVKANRCHIVYDRKRMDDKQQENPVEVNYNLAQCAFKERLRRQDLLIEKIQNEEEVGDLEALRLEAARSHELIAEIHIKRGEKERALPFAREAVRLKSELLSESDPELLTTWNILAALCLKLELFQDALDAIRDAIHAATVLFGEDSLTVATEMYHEALTHYKMGVALAQKGDPASGGNYLLALDKLERVDEIQEGILGDEEVERASTAQLLGSVHLANGDHKQARKQFERALSLRIKLFGRANIMTASSAHALGCLYARLPRRHEEAIMLLRKAALIREKRLGADSLYTAESHHELGSILMKRLHVPRSDLELALQHLSKAAQIREKKFGKETFPYSCSLHQLGLVHSHLKMYSEARLYLQAALALRERKLGKKAAQTATTRFALGVVLYCIGDYQSAMKHLKASYVARESIFGMDHQACADSLHQLGMVYVRMGQLKSALHFLLQALNLRKSLNLADVDRRHEDSDEDPYDLQYHRTDRQKRLIAKREKKKKERDREKKRHEREAKKEEERMKKEKKKRSTDKKKLRGQEEKKDGLFGSMMGRLSSAGSPRSPTSPTSPHSPGASPRSARGLAGRLARMFRRGGAPEVDASARSAAESADPESPRSPGREVEEEEEDSSGSSLAGSFGSGKSPRSGSPQASARSPRSPSGAESPGVSPRMSSRHPTGSTVAGKSPSKEKAGKMAGSPSMASLSSANGSPSKKKKKKKKKGSKGSSGEEDDVMAGTMTMATVTTSPSGKEPPKGGEEEEPRDSDDSEVDVYEIGVDIKGYLAGTIGNSLQPIATVYMDMMDFVQAKTYLNWSVAIREEVFGKVSPEMGESLHAFGVLSERQGFHILALEYFQKALKVREASCGHMDEMTSETCIQLGEVLASLGQAEDASIFLLRGISIRESIYGPNDQRVKEVKERWTELAARGMHYDPIMRGEALPHIAKRTPESFLHGYLDRQQNNK